MSTVTRSELARLEAVIHQELDEELPNGCDHHADERGSFAQCEDVVNRWLAETPSVTEVAA